MAGTARTIKTFVIENGYKKRRIVEFEKTYKVILVSTPNGAVFDIGGEIGYDGEVLQLPAGTYNWSVKLPGTTYQSQYGTLGVFDADTSLDITLYKDNIAARLNVHNSGGAPLEGVDIYIDNVKAGTTPVNGSINLDPISKGNHLINLVKDSYIFAPQEIDFSDGDKTVVMTSLPDPSQGVLSILATEDGADITINEVMIPQKTPYAGIFPPGNYTISLYKEGFVSAQLLSATVKPGVASSVYGKLPPSRPTGAVTFKSNDLVDGVVYIGSTEATQTGIGITPLTAKLEAGSYYYTIKKDGYTPVKGYQTVSANSSSLNFFTLNPIVFPAAGTVAQERVCGTAAEGTEYTAFVVYNDGVGGTYKEVLEYNSTSCGFPQAKTISVTTNRVAVITVSDSAGRIIVAKPTTPNNLSYITEFQLPVGTYYKLSAVFDAPRALPSEVELGPYKPTEFDLDLRDRGNVAPKAISISIDPYPTKAFTAVYSLTLTEGDVSSTNSTNGVGSLTYNSVTKSIDATAFMKEYIGSVANTTGQLTLTIQDENGHDLKSMSATHGATSVNSRLSYALPTSAGSIVFDSNSATRDFKDMTSTTSSSVTWTGNTSFSYICKAWTGLTEFRPGQFVLTIKVPFTFRI